MRAAAVGGQKGHGKTVIHQNTPGPIFLGPYHIWRSFIYPYTVQDVIICARVEVNSEGLIIIRPK